MSRTIKIPITKIEPVTYLSRNLQSPLQPQTADPTTTQAKVDRTPRVYQRTAVFRRAFQLTYTSRGLKELARAARILVSTEDRTGVIAELRLYFRKSVSTKLALLRKHLRRSVIAVMQLFKPRAIIIAKSCVSTARTEVLTLIRSVDVFSKSL